MQHHVEQLNVEHRPKEDFLRVATQPFTVCPPILANCQAKPEHCIKVLACVLRLTMCLCHDFQIPPFLAPVSNSGSLFQSTERARFANLARKVSCDKVPMESLHESISRWTMREHGNVEHRCGVEDHSTCSPASGTFQILAVGSKDSLSGPLGCSGFCRLVRQPVEALGLDGESGRSRGAALPLQNPAQEHFSPRPVPLQPLALLLPTGRHRF